MNDNTDTPTEGQTQYLTWSEFLTALGMPADLRALSEAQMRYGICSEPFCYWPIAGWCADEGCRAKLCHDHLQEHKNVHARATVQAELARVAPMSDTDERGDLDELAAHPQQILCDYCGAWDAEFQCGSARLCTACMEQQEGGDGE